MQKETIQKIGIISPGAMGISVAATMQRSGFEVYWASAGRSADSVARAEAHNLIDAETVANLCATCEVIVSVCPPHTAVSVAEKVLTTGFSGVYLDANAIAPQKAVHMAERMAAAGVIFVDGGIIGGPAWEPQRTWLYLSGEQAELVASFFAKGPLETAVIGDQIGQASALKMCFAAYTKGSTALLSMILAGAEALGVRANLEEQWSRGGSDFAEQTQQRVCRVTAKAWRFEGEMHEIAATFAGVGLPAGFHEAAAEVYQRLGHFKDADETPELGEVLGSLLGE
ncbi:MAG: phosphogluconate dehydrogenase [Anaerolineaceae bacterium]|nr:phosphogluconate dehydrogenase [Anaerolineaceae bacterium]